MPAPTISASMSLPRTLYAASVEQRRAEAQAATAAFRQYDGYFGAYILTYVSEDIVCKGGTLHRGYTISDPVPTNHGTMLTYSTWDTEREHVVAVPVESIIIIACGNVG